jgi:hypothetical protein
MDLPGVRAQEYGERWSHSVPQAKLWQELELYARVLRAERHFRDAHEGDWGPNVEFIGQRREMAMQENPEPKEIIVEHVRADAQVLLEKIKTTGDPAGRRQLARRAFHLAQIAAMEECPAKLAARLAGANDNGTRRAADVI